MDSLLQGLSGNNRRKKRRETGFARDVLNQWYELYGASRGGDDEDEEDEEMPMRRRRPRNSAPKNLMAGFESSDEEDEEDDASADGGHSRVPSQPAGQPSSGVGGGRRYSLRSTGGMNADGGDSCDGNGGDDDGFGGGCNGGGGGEPPVGMSQEDCEAYAKQVQLEVDHAAALEMEEEQRAERANQIQSVLTNFFARGVTAPPEQQMPNELRRSKRTKSSAQPVQWQKDDPDRDDFYQFDPNRTLGTKYEAVDKVARGWGSNIKDTTGDGSCLIYSCAITEDDYTDVNQRHSRLHAARLKIMEAGKL